MRKSENVQKSAHSSRGCYDARIWTLQIKDLQENVAVQNWHLACFAASDLVFWGIL